MTQANDLLPGQPLLEPGDALNGGQEIHDFVCELRGRSQSLGTTYYQIAKGFVPAGRIGRTLIGSRRGIAQRLAAGTGLAT